MTGGSKFQDRGEAQAKIKIDSIDTKILRGNIEREEGEKPRRRGQRESSMESPKLFMNLRMIAIRLDRVGNERLIKFLIINTPIPYARMGKSIAIEEKDYPSLKKAFDDYQTRPTINGEPRIRRKIKAKNATT
jgi:hypothetical protein